MKIQGTITKLAYDIAAQRVTITISDQIRSATFDVGCPVEGYHELLRLQAIKHPAVVEINMTDREIADDPIFTVEPCPKHPDANWIEGIGCLGCYASATIRSTHD